MIHFNCNNETLHQEILTHIDPVMNTDIFFYVTLGNENIIYNSIKDNITGKTCYPDMLIRHNFTESEITDSDIYIIADDAIRRFGSSHCFFIMVNGIESLSEFVSSVKTIFDCSNPAISREQLQYVQNFGEMLMLSTTMMHSFINLMTYYYETGGDIQSMLTPFKQEYPLPVANKKEGKIIYELIRKQILG